MSKVAERIVDSVLAYWNLYPYQSVNMVPLIDNFKNVFQDRIGYAFYEPVIDGTQKFLFHTFRDPQYSHTVERLLKKETFNSVSNSILLNQSLSMLVFKYSFDENKKINIDVVSNQDAEFKTILNVVLGLKSREMDVLENISIYDNPNYPFKNITQPVRQCCETSMIVLFNQFKSLFVSSFRRMLDEATRDAMSSPLITASIKKRRFSNLFAVVSYPRLTKRLDTFNHTSQILLTNHQLEVLIGYYGNHFVKLLEKPLSSTSRSISDTAFCSGFVEFGGLTKIDRDISDQQDHERQEIENEIYSEITKSSMQNSKKVNFIPVYINGTPWLTFYTLGDSTQHWESIYFLYRDLISKISNTIRERAVGYYIEISNAIIDKGLNTDSSFSSSLCKETNEILKVVSLFFPYPYPEIFVDEVNSFSVQVKLNPNPYWQKYLDYDDVSKYERQIKSEIRKHAASKINQIIINNRKDRVIEATYSISHLLKNKLDDTRRINEKLDDAIKEFLREQFPGKRDKELKQLYQDNFAQLFSRYENYDSENRYLLTLIDLIPKSYKRTPENNDSQIFVDIDRRSTTEQIDLLSELSKIAHVRGVEEYLEFKIKGCSISPFIECTKDNRLYAPLPSFYATSLLEAIINYNSHAEVGSKLVIDVYHEDHVHTQSVALVFRNICSSSLELQNEFKEVTIQSGFLGAIGYINNAYKKTGIGHIRNRVTQDGEHKYFELALFLNALKID